MKAMQAGLGIGLIVLALTFSAMAFMPLRFYFEDYYESNSVPFNGTVSLQLRLYNAASNGTCLFEDSNTVEVVDGFYATLIGDNTASGSLTNALADGETFVEVVINGSVLSPREPLMPVPYALNAAGLASNSVTSAMLGSEIVQTAHLSGGSVTTNKLASDVDARYVNASGDTMAGLLNMDGNSVSNVGKIVLKKNPSYMSDMSISNYYNTTYINGNPIYTGGAIYQIGFQLQNYNTVPNSRSELALQSLQYQQSGQLIGTNYTARISTTTNVMNEIRITGHLNMQGSAISNAVYSGDGAGLTNLPVTGLSANDADVRYVNAAGDSITGHVGIAGGVTVTAIDTTGPISVDASTDQTNLIVAGWAKIDYIPPQGGISMGIYTNR